MKIDVSRMLSASVLIVAALAALVGCGDDESDSASTSVKSEAAVERASFDWAKVQADYRNDFGNKCSDFPGNPSMCVTLLKSNAESLIASTSDAPASKYKGNLISSTNDLLEGIEAWDSKFCSQSYDSPDCAFRLTLIDIDSHTLQILLRSTVN